jgi:hypothetical protein
VINYNDCPDFNNNCWISSLGTASILMSSHTKKKRQGDFDGQWTRVGVVGGEVEWSLVERFGI